jgi:hypothetical protein
MKQISVKKHKKSRRATVSLFNSFKKARGSSKQYKELIESLPNDLKVHEVSTRHYMLVLAGSKEEPAVGCFCASRFATLPSLIFLDKTLPLYFKITCVLHEFGHYWCFKKGCRCCGFYAGNFFSERHAKLFELETALKHNYSLYGSIQSIGNSVCSKIFPGHFKANRSIQKTKIWKKCLETYHLASV